MTRRTILFTLLALLVAVAATADTYDKQTLAAVTVTGPEQAAELNECRVDIVGRKGDVYKVLFTPEQFDAFVSKGFAIEILYDEMAEDRRLWAEADAAAKAVEAAGVTGDERAPTFYYTASAYNTTDPGSTTLMKHLLDLHVSYPAITRLFDLGDSASGAYDILAIQVTKNPDIVEAEPKIRIYGNIHGDEKGGLMVVCEALDWILANYASDPRAQKLVDESEMWFVPMGNPDGNAANSRNNDNGVDLNRDFWSPAFPSDPGFTQPETQAIRDLTEVATADHSPKRFANSLTFHGGEVCFNSVWNYTTVPTTDEPIFFTDWTSGPLGEALPAPHGLAAAYQDGCTTPGFWFTNGGNWYETVGDTNDWSYGRWGDLDTTLEATLVKTPSVSEIPNFCAEHRQAVINYLLKTFQGIHGVMRDGGTGTPLDGTVEVTATASTTIPVPHDYQAVYTDPVAGDFHRVLQPGTYTMTCRAAGRSDLVIPGVVVQADASTRANCTWAAPDIAARGFSTADTCAVGGAGDGDGTVDPGEDCALQVTLTNYGEVAATGVSATLSTTSPGVSVTAPSAAFADLAGLGGTGPSLTSYAVHLAPTVACGTVVPLDLHVESAQGSWDDRISLPVGGGAEGGTITDFGEDFAGVTPTGLPPGWSRIAESGNLWVSSTTYFCGAAGGILYPYSTTAAADSWAFTPGISLTAGVDYTLSFAQKASSSTSLPEIFEVRAGTAAAPAGQTIPVMPSASYTNTTCATRTASFTVPASGTYYIGFHCTSARNKRYLILDDVLLTHPQEATCSATVCSVVLPDPVPDGKWVPGTAMRAARLSGNSVHLTWDVGACAASAYSVYSGPLSALASYGYDTWSCGLGTTGDADAAISSAGTAQFFVVVPQEGAVEGSHGRTGDGAERPASGVGHCASTTKEATGTCP